MTPKQLELQNILTFAKSVINSYDDKKIKRPDYLPIKHPIFEVINILARKVQADYMVSLISSEDESPKESLFNLFLPNRTIVTPDGKTFGDFKKILNVKSTANLSVDPVLPWPWKRERLIGTITNIGKGRLNGPWKEDKMNYRLHLILPIGIFEVTGGNHSISIGLLQSTGTIATKTVEDISEVYNYVFFNGQHYIRKFDKAIISEKEENFELGAIFEIGRLMKEHSISYL